MQDKKCYRASLSMRITESVLTVIFGTSRYENQLLSWSYAVVSVKIDSCKLRWKKTTVLLLLFFFFFKLVPLYRWIVSWWVKIAGVPKSSNLMFMVSRLVYDINFICNKYIFSLWNRSSRNKKKLARIFKGLHRYHNLFGKCFVFILNLFCILISFDLFVIFLY